MLVCAVMNSYSQETKFVIKKNNGYLFEEYYVLKSDKKTKHGEYVKYITSNFSNNAIYPNKREIQLIENGTYKYGKKDGTWMTYNENKISSIINYQSDSLEGEYYHFWSDSIAMKSKSYFTDQIKSKDDTIVINTLQDSLPVHIHGFFKNNKECSIWSYYNIKNELYFQYDYDKKILIKDIFNNYNNLDINSAQEIKQPIFIGGGIIELQNAFKLVLSYLPFKSNTNVIIKFHVNNEGKISLEDFTNFPFSKNKIRKLERNANLFSIDCIPRKINYKFVDSTIILEYDIKVENGKVGVSGCQTKFEDV
jgi:hypothetical protein